MPQFFRIEHDGPLARMIFVRAKGLNILSSAVLNEMKAEWAAVEHSGARVCIIRGEGKAFLAGADIREMAALDMEGARNFSALGQSVFEHIECSEVISIAAIHGACVGGGCELALACDIRIGSAGMSIGQPEVNIGLIPGFGGSQRLPRVVGMGWALRMILSGEPLSGQQALQCGLISDTGDPADLAERADALAKTILTRGPEALRLSKKLTRSALCVEQSNGLKAERYAFGNTFESGEAKEGMTAFLEKRSPKFP
jgi:enoyl-CoA hydratase